MKFSIIHPTARVTDDFESPWWKSAYAAANHCDCRENVEYIIVIHNSRWFAFQKSLADSPLPSFGHVHIVINYDRDCLVDQCNAGQLAASGEIVIGNQDDMRFPEHWDTEILKLIPDTSKRVCIHAMTHKATPDLLTLPTIATKALCDAIGPISPEYDGMFSDDEWSLQAQRFGVVISAALGFQHLHPSNGTAEMDSVYEMENREEAYAIGQRVFNRRRAAGFPRAIVPGFPVPSLPGELPQLELTNAGLRVAPRPGLAGRAIDWLERTMNPPSAPPVVEAPKVRDIAYLTPGESHHAKWTAPYVNALGTLGANGWRVHPDFNYSTNVYGTRITLTERVIAAADNLKAEGITLEYVLWQDDDNPANGEQVMRLIRQLDAHPEIAGIFGWCFIKLADPNAPKGSDAKIVIISCGKFAESGIEMRPITYDALHSNGELKPVEASGFPIFLVRFEVLKALGPSAFAPIFHKDCRLGFSGEDLAWCNRAKAAGYKFAVDPGMKVQHLKFNPEEPDYEVRGEDSPEKRKALADYLAGLNGKPVPVSPKVFMEAGKM